MKIPFTVRTETKPNVGLVTHRPGKPRSVRTCEMGPGELSIAEGLLSRCVDLMDRLFYDMEVEEGETLRSDIVEFLKRDQSLDAKEAASV